MAKDLCQHPNSLPVCISLITAALTTLMGHVAEREFYVSHDWPPKRNVREYLGDLRTSPRITSTVAESFNEMISDLSLSMNES